MGRCPVLVVADGALDRERMGEWLEEAGFEVISCPGPQGPTYVCLGGRGEACPLATEVSLVVLDVRLGSDEMMTGTPGWELLFYYMVRGKKVVALVGTEDSVVPGTDEGVVSLTRPVSREGLVAAVHALTDPVTAGARGF